MKDIYDEEGRSTYESRTFGKEIEQAVRGIIERYIAEGFNVRTLSHEAQARITDIELEYLVGF